MDHNENNRHDREKTEDDSVKWDERASKLEEIVYKRNAQIKELRKKLNRREREIDDLDMKVREGKKKLYELSNGSEREIRSLKDRLYSLEKKERCQQYSNIDKHW